MLVRKVGRSSYWHLRLLALAAFYALITASLALLAQPTGAQPSPPVPSKPQGSTTTTPSPTSTPAPDCYRAWRVVPNLDPEIGSGGLSAVDVLSPDYAWAVGYHDWEVVMAQWDGSEWTLFPTPTLTINGGLRDVEALSANNAWAVGYHLGTLIEHWDGTQWRIVPSPHFTSTRTSLEAIEALSTTDIWSVGYFQPAMHGALESIILHWNGIEWSTVPYPLPQNGSAPLYDIAALAPNDVWAVGNNSVNTLAMHWNGTEWSIVPTPSGVWLNRLYGVTAISPADVWAVGYYYGDNQIYNTLALHWDGTAWSIVPTPSLGKLNAVYARSSNDVWAIGSGSTGHTLAMHWDGAEWSVVPSPNPSPSENVLNDVDALSSTDLIAVGHSDSSPGQLLTERYGEAMIDVRPTDYYYEAVRHLFCYGAISGYMDGTFRPNNFTTRAQMCKIIVLAERWPLINPPFPHFIDVPPDHPFYTYIETAYKHFIGTGYSDGTFRPYNNITRGQLCKMVALAEEWPLSNPPNPTFTDVPATNPFYQHIETAYEHGAISGYADGTFRPFNNSTRAHIAKIVYNAVTQP